MGEAALAKAAAESERIGGDSRGPREREQVINSEGTGGAELRASEPEIRFPISFDVERCRMEEGGKEVYID